MTDLKDRIKQLLYIGADAAPEEEVLSGIIEGTSFSGAKLWILVLAIFVASLGLNTNSTAVIIGAMLISPLMGPIIGLGLSVGINDFDLMKRCFRNYLIATVFSITTATVYFLITPIAQAQSELLARTSPSIYDVLIALCGGLAGIIALNSRSQRNGNVIPGVAIATALMPPLCTVGFGIATANLSYALGALYLYIINTIFIALATFIGAKYIIGFKEKTFVDKDKERRVHRLISLVAFITIIPAILLTIGMVRETIFEQKVNSFIQAELKFDHTQIVSRNISYKNREFRIMLIGEEVDTTVINEAKEKLGYYSLADVKMQVIQNVGNFSEEDIKSMLEGELTKENQQFISQQSKIQKIEEQLDQYKTTEEFAAQLHDEMKTLFPHISRISTAKGIEAYTQDSLSKDTTTTLVILESTKAISNEETEKLKEWMQKRIKQDNIQIIIKP